jgi:hypothetical protein
MTDTPATDEELMPWRMLAAGPGGERTPISRLIARLDEERDRAKKMGWTPDVIPCEKCGGLVGYDNAKLGADGISYLCASCRLKEVEAERAEERAGREKAERRRVTWEMVYEGASIRATVAEAESDRLAGLLRRALDLIEAMRTNDPNEPASDAGHTCRDIWAHEEAQLRSALARMEGKP